jgi:hypothetical protein
MTPHSNFREAGMLVEGLMQVARQKLVIID